MTTVPYYCLYCYTGQYKDDAGVRHNTRTVEVYLPWSQSWRTLPTLPTFTTTDGVQYNITDAHIFSLQTDGGYSLSLVGGLYHDLTRNVVLPTKYIYTLRYNGTYHWDHNSDLIHDMGK